jgi:hypothetical protein
MSLESVASIGLQALKHRQQIGTALNGLAGLAHIGGGQAQAFSKILGQKLQMQNNSNIDGTTTSQSLNTLSAMAGLAYFDADHNGQVSKQELTDGLQKLNASGGQGALSTKLNALGQNLLKNYDKLAGLDSNNAGLNYRDLDKLANQDGHMASISNEDWQSLIS